MSKPATAASALAGNIVIRHHCTPESDHHPTPGQAEILVSGKRVGYVGYGEGHPVSLFRPEYLGFKLSAAEVKTINEVARAEAAKLAKAEQTEADELAKALAGE